MDPSRLREARERERISQRQLADEIGVSYSQMSRYESGERRMRLDEARKIPDKLKISITDIMGDEAATGQGERRGSLVTLPLPEGRAILEYPSKLSPESRQQFREWLELIAKVATRE